MRTRPRSRVEAQISIDTSKAAVARACIEAGATLVNDVTALRGDPAMAELVAARGADCCLMHMLGEPRTMQADPRYEDVVDDVRAFLEERMAHAVREGVREERIMLDPGIGFGKTLAHNLALLARLEELQGVTGASRWWSAPRARASSGAFSPMPPVNTEPVAAVAGRLEGAIAT